MLDLEIPQLLVHGTQDTAVPIESARLSVAAFQKAGRLHLTYWELEGYDHSLSDVQGVSHKIDILNRSIQWLLRSDGE